ncbi:hypothetical protein [Pedobacter borealis]|uniref:hypothetical protein n=1 Tax=Pedobacter borealis TaxID=475254 RepID=UPI0006EBC6EB|nr:hypothetical protein [Pedobacter borealis]
MLTTKLFVISDYSLKDSYLIDFFKLPDSDIFTVQILIIDTPHKYLTKSDGSLYIPKPINSATTYLDSSPKNYANSLLDLLEVDSYISPDENNIFLFNKANSFLSEAIFKRKLGKIVLYLENEQDYSKSVKLRYYNHIISSNRTIVKNLLSTCNTKITFWRKYIKKPDLEALSTFLKQNLFTELGLDEGQNNVWLVNGNGMSKDNLNLILKIKDSLSQYENLKIIIFGNCDVIRLLKYIPLTSLRYIIFYGDINNELILKLLSISKVLFLFNEEVFNENIFIYALLAGCKLFVKTVPENIIEEIRPYKINDVEKINNPKEIAKQIELPTTNIKHLDLLNQSTVFEQNYYETKLQELLFIISNVN